MDHFYLNDELRQQLLESAAWTKAGISPILESDSEETSEEETLEEGYKARKTKKKSSKRMAPPMSCEDTDHEDGEEVEDLEEAVHVCPLCTSQLDEALEEEAILEHLDIVLGLVDRLSQINEGEENVDSIIEDALVDLLYPEDSYEG